MRSELLVQVIEVDRKVSGPGRGNVVFRVDSDARMIGVGFLLVGIAGVGVSGGV